MSVLQRLDLTDFGPHAQLAREMGFDRGELLSRWRAFLFVEGRTDVAVIEELLGEELDRARICLLPVHGHGHHAGLIDMATFVLATTTPIAALFDAITDEQIRRLRRASAAERAKARADGGELGTVASIIDIEVRRDRDQIAILTVGVPDIFDLLDEDAVRRTVPRRFRGKRFPGHRSARTEFDERGGGNARAYKAFVEREYGVRTTERVMREIARAMKAGGTAVPAQLSDILLRVEQMALVAERWH